MSYIEGTYFDEMFDDLASDFNPQTLAELDEAAKFLSNYRRDLSIIDEFDGIAANIRKALAEVRTLPERGDWYAASLGQKDYGAIIAMGIEKSHRHCTAKADEELHRIETRLQNTVMEVSDER